MQADLVDIAPDLETAAQRAARWIAGRISAAEGPFRMALSGGNTPRPLYRALASEPCRGDIPWARVELFWGDERFVPYTDERSNYRMARESLLAHAPVWIDHVHPMPTTGEPEDAAQRYETLLKQIYGADSFEADRPLFDLILLGLGEDGHTASLFPGNPTLDEHARWVVSSSGPTEPRLTLTYPAICSSAAVMFLVSGAGKAEMLARVMGGDKSLPAARVRSQGEVVWFLDEAAAAALPATRAR